MTPPPPGEEPELKGSAVEYFDGCRVVGETRLEGVVLKAENAGAAVDEETNEGAVVGKAENLEPDKGGEMDEEETTEEEEREEENCG